MGRVRATKDGLKVEQTTKVEKRRELELFFRADIEGLAYHESYFFNGLGEWCISTDYYFPPWMHEEYIRVLEVRRSGIFYYVGKYMERGFSEEQSIRKFIHYIERYIYEIVHRKDLRYIYKYLIA